MYIEKCQTLLHWNSLKEVLPPPSLPPHNNVFLLTFRGVRISVAIRLVKSKRGSNSAALAASSQALLGGCKTFIFHGLLGCKGTYQILNQWIYNPGYPITGGFGVWFHVFMRFSFQTSWAAHFYSDSSASVDVRVWHAYTWIFLKASGGCCKSMVLPQP